MPELRNQYTVSELNAQIRFLLEGAFSDIWVTGEISNFHYHPSSGHMYFTMKDGRGEMQCAMFRGNNQYLKFKPSDGMEVRVLGSVSIYEQRGQVQLIVSRMEPAGLGDLFKAFEALKKCGGSLTKLACSADFDKWTSAPVHRRCGGFLKYYTKLMKEQVATIKNDQLKQAFKKRFSRFLN